MLNMIILKTLSNHSKSLNLGPGDSFSSNFTIFEKNNSNCLALELVCQNAMKKYPDLAPVKIF